MQYGGGATAGAAAAAARARAIKASGAIIQVDPDEFLKLAEQAEEPLIVMSPKSFWSGGFKYMTSYKGLFFYTKSSEALRLPSDTELVLSKKIWIP